MVRTVRTVTGGPPPARRMASSRSSRLTWPGSTECTRTPSPTRSATRSGTTSSATRPPASASLLEVGRQDHRPDLALVRHLAVPRQPCVAPTTPTPSRRSCTSRRPSSSASDPDAATRPRSRITTRSQTRSTSPMRCELSSTATPRALSESTMSRTSARPSGSSALVGSSRTTRSGPGHQRDRQAEPLLHALGEAAHAVARAGRPDPRAPARPAARRPGRRHPTRRTCRLSTSVGREPGLVAEQLREVAHPLARARVGGRAAEQQHLARRPGAPGRAAS